MTWLTLSQIENRYAIGKASVRSAIKSDLVEHRLVRNGGRKHYEVERTSLLRYYGRPLKSPRGDNQSERACVDYYLANHCALVPSMSPETVAVWEAGRKIYNERKRQA